MERGVQSHPCRTLPENPMYPRLGTEIPTDRFLQDIRD